MRLAETLKRISDESRSLRESFNTRTSEANRGGGLAGYKRKVIRGQFSPEYKARLAEAAEVIADCIEGIRPMYHFTEAMTSDDFPILLGDIQHIRLMGSFQKWPIDFPGYFKMVKHDDLNETSEAFIDDPNTELLALAEREPYKELVFAEGQYLMQLGKFGRRYSITLEMTLRDKLKAFQDRPASLGNIARRSEQLLATRQLVGTAGLNTTFFSGVVSTGGNILDGNPPLSHEAFQAAFTYLSEKRDANNVPIRLDLVNLVVSPGDEILAQSIVNATDIEVSSTGPGGSTGITFRTKNFLTGRLKVHVNPELRTIATGLATRPWFLIASTADPSGRAAFIFANLTGREQPQLFVKDSDARQLGSGTENPFEGSFDSDSLDYKVRHFYGAGIGDTDLAIGSDSSGS